METMIRRTPLALVSAAHDPWREDEFDSRVIVAMAIAPDGEDGHIAYVVPEGLKTSDRRSIDAGALTWRNPPLPLMFIDRYTYGHDEAVFVGNLTNFRKEEVEGIMWVIADVEWDSFEDNENAAEAFRLVDSGKMSGISADITDVVADLVVHEVDEEGWPVDWEEVIRSGVVAAATIVPIPAFAAAHITRRANGGAPDEEAAEEDSLAASGIDIDKLIRTQDGSLTIFADDTVVVMFEPDTVEDEATEEAPVDEPAVTIEEELAAMFDTDVDRITEAITAAMVEMPEPYPAAWFADPQLDGPTAKTVTADGRVFGHMALWNSCHTAYSDACVTAPKPGPNGFAAFLLGNVDTDEGEIPVGTLTMNTGHAGMGHGPKDTIAHYDNTGTAAAYVNVGADDHGIWFAGVLAPNLTAEQVRTFKAAKLSGDWRVLEDGNGLELVACLAVNTPGFPVPQARVASAHQTALVAGGAVKLEPVVQVATADDSVAPADDPTTRALIRLASRLFARLDKIEERLTKRDEIEDVDVDDLDRSDKEPSDLDERIADAFARINAEDINASTDRVQRALDAFAAVMGEGFDKETVEDLDNDEAKTSDLVEGPDEEEAPTEEVEASDPD